jgi:hypothetical protein
MNPVKTGLFILVCLGLAACGETAQTASKRKADVPAYTGTGGYNTAAGWKPGDAASWEAQLRTRSQGQNEYTRTGSH